MIKKLHMTFGESAANSPMAAAMGASIKITGPGLGMYFISGASASIESMIKKAGGQVILRLGAGKMLATLSFVGHLALRNSSSIAHIGPVSVDRQRLSKVVELIANANGPKNGNTV
jgi:hypothetical protein